MDNATLNLWLAMVWSFLCGVNLLNLAMPFNLTIAALNAVVAIMYGWRAMRAIKAAPTSPSTQATAQAPGEG